MGDVHDKISDNEAAVRERELQQREQTPKVELPYDCYVEGLGRLTVLAVSPSDMIAKLEELHGVAKPGDETRIAFTVPQEHCLGGSNARGPQDLQLYLS